MEIFDIMQKRRSIRKYTGQQIPRDVLEKIIAAGLQAPTAGGRQGTWILALHDRNLTTLVGKMNVAHFDRSRLLGGFVSREQPSIIDNPTMQNGFYGAPCVCAVFAAKNFLYSVPDAFCAAENMVLAATALGVASCIVARGEATFANEDGEELLRKWGVPEEMVCRCFVILGYADGPVPPVKALNPDRLKIITAAD